MIWKRLRQHQPQVEMFRRAVQRERLGQAYLLIGPSGVGKRLVAQGVAQSLFCERIPNADLDACGECPPCRQLLAGTHPDMLTIACPEGKREIPIKLMVGENETRGQEGLCYEFSRRPMLAKRRIAIIDDADCFNAESGNSLLKTLEEPPPGGILFLITPSIDALLPTIRSRCQPMYFSPLTESDVVELLLESRLTESQQAAHQAASLARGSLSMAKRLLEPGLAQLRDTVSRMAVHGESLGMKSADQLSQEIDELATGPLQRDYARLAIAFFAEEWRNGMSADSLPDHEIDRRTQLLERCAAAEQHLDSAMPVPLCLESLLTECGRLSRE